MKRLWLVASVCLSHKERWPRLKVPIAKASSARARSQPGSTLGLRSRTTRLRFQPCGCILCPSSDPEQNHEGAGRRRARRPGAIFD